MREQALELIKTIGSNKTKSESWAWPVLDRWMKRKEKKIGSAGEFLSKRKGKEREEVNAQGGGNWGGTEAKDGMKSELRIW